MILAVLRQNAFWRRASSLVLIVAAIAVFVGAGAAFAAGEYKEGEAIVLLRHNSFTQSAAAARDISGSVRSYAAGVARLSNASLVKTYDALSSSESGIFAFVRSHGEDTRTLIERLNNNPGVISAMPNYIVETAASQIGRAHV